MTERPSAGRTVTLGGIPEGHDGQPSLGSALRSITLTIGKRGMTCGKEGGR